MGAHRRQSGCFLAPSPLPAQTSTATPNPTAITFSLSGQVTDSTTSTPISDATVSVADSVNGGKLAGTDASGNYTLTALQPVGFSVNVTANGYVTSSKSVTLTANSTLSFPLARLTIPITVTVHGTVTDGTSGGVSPNIVVQITSCVNAGKSTRTDGTGDYNIGSVTVGSFEMSVAAVSYYMTTTQATVSAFDSRRDFVLEPIPGPPPPPPPNEPGPGGGVARLVIASARSALTDGSVQQQEAVLVLVTVVFYVGDTATEHAPILDPASPVNWRASRSALIVSAKDAAD